MTTSPQRITRACGLKLAIRAGARSVAARSLAARSVAVRSLAARSLAARSLAAAIAVAVVAACASSAATSAVASPTPSAAASTQPSRGISDLGITDKRPGTGARASNHQCLYVHYIGLLPDGRQFDSTRDPLPNGRPQSPVAFELGTGIMMPGWEKGLVGMQVGGLRQLWVPFRLAYGAGGRPPAIPPRTDLVFDIELMAVAPTVPTSSSAPRAETAPTCPSWGSVSRGR